MTIRFVSVSNPTLFYSGSDCAVWIVEASRVEQRGVGVSYISAQVRGGGQLTSIRRAGTFASHGAQCCTFFSCSLVCDWNSRQEISLLELAKQFSLSVMVSRE